MKYIDAEKLKTEIERNIKHYEKSDRDDFKNGELYICQEILSIIESLQQEQTDMGEVSDGYHTFNELYYYRMLYNASFFNELAYKRDNGHWDVDYDVHKSKKHSGGEDCFGGGWFIVMAELPTGQISNHYEMKYWDYFKIPEKEKANVWDGHTSQEAAERLHRYLQQEQPEVDLERFTEKMNAWKALYNYPNNIQIKATMAFTARMFYMYPNVAREWYDNLPKVTQD